MKKIAKFGKDAFDVIFIAFSSIIEIYISYASGEKIEKPIRKNIINTDRDLIKRWAVEIKQIPFEALLIFFSIVSGFTILYALGYERKSPEMEVVIHEWETFSQAAWDWVFSIFNIKISNTAKTLFTIQILFTSLYFRAMSINNKSKDKILYIYIKGRQKY